MADAGKGQKRRIRCVLTCFGWTGCALFMAWMLQEGFLNNRWGVAQSRWFERHQLDTQAHVLGNIIQTRREGWRSHMGFNGVSVSRVRERVPRRWPGGRIIQDQYRLFLEGRSRSEYDPYFSQPGVQGMLFAGLDQVLPESVEDRLHLFQQLTAWSTALLLVGVVAWVVRVWGITAGVATFASMLFSPWLTVFGRNLWWVTGVFFLPLVLLGWGCSRSRPRGRVLFVLGFTALMIKCLLTGFEYISTTLVLSQIPVIYCFLVTRDSWPVRFGCAAGSVLGVICGTVFVAGLMVAQINAVTGDASRGWGHLTFSYRSRTTHEGEAEGRLSLLETYNNGVWLNVGQRGAGEGAPGRIREARPGMLRFRDAHRALFLVSPWLLTLALMDKTRRRLLLAAGATTVVSVLAPISWFTLFYQHSRIHTFMNDLCWVMPYTLLVAGCLGLLLDQTCRQILRGAAWVVRKAKVESRLRCAGVPVKIL